MNVSDLLEIQALAFPLIKAFGGPDIAEDFIRPGGDYLKDGAAVLRAAAELLETAGTSLEDGQLTLEEINKTIDKFETLEDVIHSFGQPDLPT